MTGWKLALASLCLVGFLKEMNFLGQFLDFYLGGQGNSSYNLTGDQLQYQIYPVYSYTYVCIIVLVILTADLVYYKPVIFLGVLALIVNITLVTWGEGGLVAQLAMFALAFSKSTDVAYFSYAFAVTDPEQYSKASGFSRAALLFGRMFGLGIGQILVYLFDTQYSVLNYVTLAFLIVALVLSAFIPSAIISSFQQVIERELQSPEHGRFQNQISVAGSIQNPLSQGEITQKRGDNSRGADIHNTTQDSIGHPFPPGPMFYDIDTSSLGFSYNDMMSESSDMSSIDRSRIEDSQQLDFKESENMKEKFLLSVNSAKETFSNTSVIMWSVYWIILTFVNFQLGETIHPFLDEKYRNRDDFKVDGPVESVSLLIGAVSVLCVSFIRISFSYSTFLMAAASLVLSVLVVMVTVLEDVWLNICMYGACRVLYQVIITIAMYAVASEVSGRRFAVVLGFNMFLSGVLQLVFTGTRAADTDSHFTLLDQLSVYAGILGLLSLVLFVKSVHSLLASRCRSNSDARDDLDTLVRE